MKFTIHKDPLPFLYIEDIFSKEELTIIYRELDFIQPKLLSPENTQGAKDKDGNYKKKNTGVFLDEIFPVRKFSDILTINRKIFCEELIKAAIECTPGYGILKTCSRDSTLISYYENSDYYDPHFDTTAISIVTWFFKQPKNFTGGEFTFTDYNINIPPKNNSGILFFSSYLHEVSSTDLIDSTAPGSGRFSMSLFCSHK
jgi:hypothetical protein